MRRILALSAAGLTIALAGCGEDEKSEGLLTEGALRECLSDGLSEGPEGGSGGYLLLLPAPDFVVSTEDGTDVSATVYGTEEKAERAAADARSAIQTLGDSVELVSERNAVLIFNPAPSEETLQAAESCLG